MCRCRRDERPAVSEKHEDCRRYQRNAPDRRQQLDELFFEEGLYFFPFPFRAFRRKVFFDIRNQPANSPLYRRQHPLKQDVLDEVPHTAQPGNRNLRQQSEIFIFGFCHVWEITFLTTKELSIYVNISNKVHCK